MHLSRAALTEPHLWTTPTVCGVVAKSTARDGRRSTGGPGAPPFLWLFRGRSSSTSAFSRGCAPHAPFLGADARGCRGLNAGPVATGWPGARAAAGRFANDGRPRGPDPGSDGAVGV